MELEVAAQKLLWGKSKTNAIFSFQMGHTWVY